MTTRRIQAATLTTYDVASDGSHVRMHMLDQDGQAASLVLPTTCLNQLLMTLPAMVQAALRNGPGDGSRRLVHSIDECTLESGEADARGVEQLILTLTTSGGFSASYVAPVETLASVAHSILNQVPEHFEAGRTPRLLS